MTTYGAWPDVPFGEDLGNCDGPSLAMRVGAESLVMPYNYVPFYEGGPSLEGPPPTQSRFVEQGFSGAITLAWTAQRAILAGVLSGESGPYEVDHKEVRIPIFDIPCTPDGRPVLQGTMSKGPLRSLYAAVTGSRLDRSPSVTALSYRDGAKKQRVPYPNAPADLLPTGLRPPGSPSEFSAAQRVFGTVVPDKPSMAYRGLLCFGGMRCRNVVLPKPSPSPWTLAPQGQPGAGYARFTTVAAPDGRQIHGRRKQDFFLDGDQLAGRRVWLHHATAPKVPPEGGWAFVADDGVADERRYLAAGSDNPTQLSQFSGWIPAGAIFEQTVRFSNLSEYELGALLWVLDQPRYHHLGRARGFGFGTVAVERTVTRIQSHSQRCASLTRLASDTPHLAEPELIALADRFEKRAIQEGGKVVLEAALNAAVPYRGVRYPTLEEYVALEKGDRPARKALSGRRS